MIRIVLALVVMAVLFYLYNRWRRLPKKERRIMALKVITIAVVSLAVLGLLTGRMHWLGAVFAGLLAVAKFGFGTLVRALPFLGFLRRSPFLNQPRFKTPYLDLQVNLQSGEVLGKITDGPHAGMELGALNNDQLQELESFYQDKDKRSYYLIRVIRQRASQESQQHTGGENQQHNYQSVGNPSVEEALQILGLGPNPSKKDIIKAHRSLMQKFHPDRGGNDYLASRVNLAKETLIKQLYPK